MTRRNHVPILELHGFSTLGPELATNNNLTALGATLHDKPKNTIASPSDSKSTEELVAEGLGLGDGAETAVVHLLRVELDAALREVEALLNHRSQFPDPPTLLAEDVLGAGGADYDLGAHGGDTDLDTGVAVLRELAGEHLVKLGEEHTIRHELPLLADRVSGRHW